MVCINFRLPPKKAIKYFSLNTHLIINPYYYCSFSQVTLKHKYEFNLFGLSNITALTSGLVNVWTLAQPQ